MRALCQGALARQELEDGCERLPAEAKDILADLIGTHKPRRKT